MDSRPREFRESFVELPEFQSPGVSGDDNPEVTPANRTGHVPIDPQSLLISPTCVPQFAQVPLGRSSPAWKRREETVSQTRARSNGFLLPRQATLIASPANVIPRAPAAVRILSAAARNLPAARRPEYRHQLAPTKPLNARILTDYDTVVAREQGDSPVYPSFPLAPPPLPRSREHGRKKWSITAGGASRRCRCHRRHRRRRNLIPGGSMIRRDDLRPVVDDTARPTSSTHRSDRVIPEQREGD